MADTRPTQAFKIVDPTTKSQQASVDASGRLTVVVGVALPAGANNIGSVNIAAFPASTFAGGNLVQIDYDTGGGTQNMPMVGMALPASGGSVAGGTSTNPIRTDPTGTTTQPVSIAAAIDTELPAAAALADATSNPTVPGVGAFNLLYNGATWDRLRGDTANGVDVDVTRMSALVAGAAVIGKVSIDQTTPGTTNLVDTELPAAAALADAAANPTVPAVGAFAMGYNGATWDRIRVANTGRLQVDVVSGASEVTPTNPVTEQVVSSALAAGASVAANTADKAAATKLWALDLVSSVAWKAVISSVANAVATTKSTVFGRAGESVRWFPPHRNFVSIAGGTAGQDGFRVDWTNEDTSEAADMYATFHMADN